MTKRHSDFTDDELDTLVALAQKWEKHQGEHWKGTDYYPHWDTKEEYGCLGQRNLISVLDYQPTRNGAQAMELVEEFGVNIATDEDGSVIASTEITARKVKYWQSAPTPKRAICLAVVSSKFSVEEAQEILNGF